MKNKDNVKTLDEIREDFVAVSNSLNAARLHLEQAKKAKAAAEEPGTDQQADKEQAKKAKAAAEAAQKAAEEAVGKIAERLAEKKKALVKQVNIVANAPKELSDEELDVLRLAAETAGRLSVYLRAYRHSTVERWNEWKTKKKARRHRARQNRRARRLREIQEEIDKQTRLKKEKKKEKEERKLLRSTSFNPGT